MRNVIFELLASSKTKTEQIIEPLAAELINQLLCDCMATAMYRCLDHMPRDKQGLAKTRLAEYGFSKEEIEKSISKLETE